MQNPQSTIQQLYDNQGMLDILIAIEKYFEDNDLYAYKDIQSDVAIVGKHFNDTEALFICMHWFTPDKEKPLYRVAS